MNLIRKIIPCRQQYIDQDDIATVVSTLQSDWITQGPKVEEFEHAVADYCEAKYAVGVSSGTAALHLAGLCAGFSGDDKVVTSPITFVASANSVIFCGARPTFSDIDPMTCCLDITLLEDCLPSGTKGIIPVHFGGQPCDLERLGKLAKKENLVVIEDASHAIGATYTVDGKNYRIGCCQHSDMTTFSFHPVKNMTTGEGGMITTNCEKTYRQLLQLRAHGITREPELLSHEEGCWYYEMQSLGFNYRITDMQCALGITQLAKLDDFIKRRRWIVARYNSAFQNNEELILLNEEHGVSACHLYVLQFKTLDRRQVFNHLWARGLHVNVHFIPVHLQPYYREKYGYQKGDFPKSEQYYDRAVSMPLFPAMEDSDVDYVIESVFDVIKELKK